MKRKYSGAVTLYLALTLGIMLTLVFVLIETVRTGTIRMEAESVMDIALFSVFGEYHRELLSQYDLFYIDTGYGEGAASIERSEEHLQYFMNQNFRKDTLSEVLGIRDITALSCDNVTFENYVRPSDDRGAVLKQQIVDYMRNKAGIQTGEEILQNIRLFQGKNAFTRDVEAEWSKARQKLSSLERAKREERKHPETGELPAGIDNPASRVWKVKNQGILGTALPSGTKISSITIHPEYYFSERKPLEGKPEVSSSAGAGSSDRFFLQAYLMDKCSSYANVLDKSLLKYQLEYLLHGNPEDSTNLRKTAENILRLREVINFTYLMTDKDRMSKAETLAMVLSAILFTPEIKDALKLTILYAWSYAESVQDVRILLDGNKLPLLKDSNSWDTPLSQLLTFTSHLEEYPTTEQGMKYEDYLNMFLYLTSEETILKRFMDICEMDIRLTPGNEYFQMDGCIDAVRARANIKSDYGDGFEIIRKYKYE